MNSVILAEKRTPRLTHPADRFVDLAIGATRAQPPRRGPIRAVQRYECCACRYVYDERIGDPDDGIAPGTRWALVPCGWGCPDCGRPKSGFANTID